jgi:K(+)-stimulated pyrophosphate-energized sodium pump
MSAVGRAAMAMIKEVRRQFKEIPELKNALVILNKYDADMSKASEEDKKIYDKAYGLAEYEKCVDISTKASLKEMLLPGLLAVATPVLVGFIGGAEMLGGLLAGVTVTGVLMAIFQSNAGGAWDNAKKMVEEGVTIDGVEYKKGSEPHKATVVGDTVGDPFKDTSGPSLNILLKLMSVVALVIAPSIALNIDSVTAYNKGNTSIELHENTNSPKNTEMKVLVKKENGEKNATVITTTEINGRKEVVVETIEGDEVDTLITNHE